MSEAEKSYLAGIIDGEGTISIYRFSRKGATSTHHMLVIVVATTTPRLMVWLRRRFGGSFTARTPKPPRRKFWRWVIYQENAGQVLRACLPYLIVKSRHARLGLKFLAERGEAQYEAGKNRLRKFVSPETLARRERYAAEIHRLNHSQPQRLSEVDPKG